MFGGKILKNKKIIITGGAGFIGSNIARTLFEDNEIIILDNFLSGRLKNITDLVEDNFISFVSGSIMDKELLKKTFKNADYIFHLAAIPSISESIEDPFHTSEINVAGTINILYASLMNDIKKVIFASSAAIYGNMVDVPNKENMIPYPTSPYAIQKLSGEHYCRIFYEIYGLPTTSLRYYNVYGPNQNPYSDYAAVIPKFINNVIKNESPIIFGDGNQTRDFIFVQDIVEANLLAAENKASNGKSINIATGKAISIGGLAQEIISTAAKTIRPKYVKARKGDIRHSLGDVSLAKEILGFEAKCSLKKGLSETIWWLDNERR